MTTEVTQVFSDKFKEAGYAIPDSTELSNIHLTKQIHIKLTQEEGLATLLISASYIIGLKTELNELISLFFGKRTIINDSLTDLEIVINIKEDCSPLDRDQATDFVNQANATLEKQCISLSV